MIFNRGRASRSRLFTLQMVILCLLILSPPCFGKARYGMVLAGSNYASCNGEFVDMLVHASAWSVWDVPAGSPTLTADGYPAAGTANCIVCPMGYQSGICSFYGKGDFTLNMDPKGTYFKMIPGTLQKQDNITRCQFQVNVPPAGFPGSSPWALMGVSNINPLNPPDDFHLICPGRYKAWPETQEIFTDAFLAAESPFSIWRMAVDNPGGIRARLF